MNSPTFLNLLHDPQIKTVLCVGTGGGFDFTGSAFFIPNLQAAGKKIVIHSYSFGTTSDIQNVVHFHPAKFIQYQKTRNADPQLIDLLSSLVPTSDVKNKWPLIAITDGKSYPNQNRYGPECSMVQFLDEKYPSKDQCCCPEYEYFEEEYKKLVRGQENEAENTNNEAIPQNSSHHWIYTSYARDWTAKALKDFYQFICLIHNVDAILCIDGGSDSLLKVDPRTESGFGDPIEDAVTVAAVAKLPEMLPSSCFGSMKSADDDKNDDAAAVTTEKQEKRHFVPVRVLVSLGFGCDRFNDVSDETSFQCVAELTQLSRNVGNEIEERHSFVNNNDDKKTTSSTARKKICGFLGSIAMERFSASSQFYSDLIKFTQRKFSFNSIIANSIMETLKGAYGSDEVPESLQNRVRPGSLYLWPLMSIAFAFDVRLMYERSLLCPVLYEKCDTFHDMQHLLWKIQAEKHELMMAERKQQQQQQRNIATSRPADVESDPVPFPKF